MHRLTDLADVCRRAGLNVIEVTGWQTRGRGGDGGFYRPGRPDYVMVHHTASNWSATQDVAFLATGHQFAPVSNLYLARNGDVYVIAAGPTNTNGRGSIGDVVDDMNRHAIGIEAGNTGTGEPWPAVQQDAYVILCAALCDGYDIAVANVAGHFEYAPTRKIDPAGPSVWADTSDRYQRWHMDEFRADVALALPVDPPTPQPDEGDDPMLVIRIDGYADQFIAVPIDNPQARRKMGIPDDQAPVVVKADASAIEAQIPYALTRLGS